RFLFSGLDNAEDALLGIASDDRADHITRLFRKPNGQGTGCSDEALDKFVVIIREYDEPGKGAAFLALIAESGGDATDDGFVHICIAIDNDTVLAAHFADDLFQIGLAGS